MKTTVEAIYQHGNLVLSQPLALPEETQVQVTVETSDIVELLTPLIPELNQNVYSPTEFMRKRKELLQNVRESKRPLVLNVALGLTALVVDARGYVELEQRRKNLADLLTRIPGNPTLEQIWPTVGRRTCVSLKGKIEARERLKSKIEGFKRREAEMRLRSLDPLLNQRHAAEKELEEVEEQIAKLTTQLGEK
jgi:predicted DNA-binding antitoxin AbrB/MazE fold protein